MLLNNKHNLMTLEQISTYLSINPKTIRKWVFQRRIPVIRLGEGKRRLLRFRLTDIDKWIEDHNELPRY